MTGRRGRREGSYCIIILSLHTLNFTTHNADVCMYLCMHVYKYVCKHVCIYLCMYACMYVICMFVLPPFSYADSLELFIDHIRETSHLNSVAVLPNHRYNKYIYKLYVPFFI